MKITVTTDYITLGQLLKLAGIVQTGGEVKSFLARHRILVNNIPVQERGKKLYPGDRVDADGMVLELFGD